MVTTRVASLLLGVVVLAASAQATMIEVVAGGGIGDGLPATEAPIDPLGVAVDGDGNVYLSDNISSRVRRVDAGTGVISTVIGSERGFCGYDGPGTAVCLAEPRGMSFGPDGALYVADLGTVRRWDPMTGLASRIAGRAYYDPTPCVPGFPAPALEACMLPWDVGIEGSTGAAFVLAPDARRVFRVDPLTGVVSVYAGLGFPQDFICGEGGPATGACLGYGQGMAVGPDGAVYVAILFDGPRVWRIDPATRLIERVAGGGTPPACFADDLPATEACISPRDVAVAPNGDLLLTGFQDGVQRVDATTHRLTDVPGGGGGWQIAVDAAGRIYTASVDIFRFDPATGAQERIAGNGTTYYCGDGGPATTACLSPVQEIAVDGSANLFIADPNELGLSRLRRVDATTGVISTLATDQECAFTPGTDPPGLCLRERFRLAAGPGGQLVASDVADDGMGRTIVRVSRVDPVTGARTTIAGLCTRPEASGIPALDACLGDVRDVAIDADDNVFVAEAWRVLRIDSHTGNLDVAAGSGVAFCTPTDDPDGPALPPCLQVQRIASGPDGTLFVVARSGASDRVLSLDLAHGTLATVAGNGQSCVEPVADGQPATAGCLTVQSIAADSAGNLFIGSRGRVRRVDATTHRLSTLGGRPPDPGGFDPCCEACTNPPECMRAVDLGIDASGRVYTAEPAKRAVRRITVTCDETGAGAVACACPATLDAAACSGDVIPRSVAKAASHGCLLATGAAETGDPRRGRQVLRAAAKQLRTALRRLDLARRRARVSDTCAGALAAQLEIPAERAKALLEELSGTATPAS